MKNSNQKEKSSFDIYLATASKDKIREFEEILGFKLKRTTFDFEEIQSVKVKKVIRHKTKQAFKEIERSVICEDTGLYLEEWGGLPGALAKIFEEKLGWEKVCQMIQKNRKAKAETIIGFYDGKKYKSFKGEIEGEITESPRGENGFGWDSIFIPKGKEKTFGEMKKEEKNEISMRKEALIKLKKYLTNG